MDGSKAARDISRRAFLASGTALGMALMAGRAPAAQARGTGEIAADIANASAVRAVKRLQRAWGHYAEAGDFEAMAGLFAAQGRLVMPPAEATGPDAILAALRQMMGDKAGQLGPDRLNIRLMLSPVVTVSADGDHAQGRWHELGMTGVHGQSAHWSGGIHENDYVRENGRWKIATLHFHPQFEGPYETGWRNIAETVAFVPYHYTPAGAGAPVPLQPPARPGTPPRLSALRARARALADESAVQNLQAAYGHYMDRKLWDDVADLFAPDGRIEIGGVGVWMGRASIRKGLERFGPPGLKDGQLFDHLQLMPIIDVAPDGMSADLRCFELQMLGIHGQSAQWGFSICEMRAEKRGGTWMIAAMTLSPRMLADYDKGWAHGLLPMPGPDPAFPPDRPAALITAYPAAKSPVIGFAHPVTADPAGPDDLPGDASLAATERDLFVAKAHDGAENIACAYGYYIDEFKWDETADLFSTEGWKELSYIGTYVGRESIRRSLFARYGDRGRSSTFLAIHQKIEPYVTVLPDGRARIRLKLFQVNSARESGSGYISGIYEDQAAQEDGVWKIAGMDLDYVFLANYAGGWAAIEPGASRRFAPKPEDAARMAPDGPLRGVTFAPYPEIGPAAFHFANPVSGRQPPILLPWSDGHFAAPAASG